MQFLLQSQQHFSVDIEKIWTSSEMAKSNYENPLLHKSNENTDKNLSKLTILELRNLIKGL